MFMAVNSTSADVNGLPSCQVRPCANGRSRSCRRGGFPTLREHADRLAVGIEIDQVFLNLAADDVDAGGSLDARIELALLGAVVNVNTPPFFGVSAQRRASD